MSANRAYLQAMDDPREFLVLVAVGFFVICAWLLSAARSRIRRIERRLDLDPQVNIDTAPKKRDKADRNGWDPQLRIWIGVLAVFCWTALAAVILVALLGLAFALAGWLPV